MQKCSNPSLPPPSVLRPPLAHVLRSKAEVTECCKDPQCVASRWRRRGRRQKRREMICTSNHLVKTSADRSVSLSLLPCLSLMFSFCLTLTDLLRGGDQNESPAPFSLHPVLSLLLTSTDSIFSSLPGSAHVPQPAYLAWSLTEKNKEESWLRKEDEEEGVRREGEKYLFFFFFLFFYLRGLFLVNSWWHTRGDHRVFFQHRFFVVVGCFHLSLMLSASFGFFLSLSFFLISVLEYVKLWCLENLRRLFCSLNKQWKCQRSCHSGCGRTQQHWCIMGSALNKYNFKCKRFGPC